MSEEPVQEAAESRKVIHMGNITIKDVASEAGLSIATVSYVLNQKENLPEETKKLVYQALNIMREQEDIIL